MDGGPDDGTQRRRESYFFNHFFAGLSFAQKLRKRERDKIAREDGRTGAPEALGAEITGIVDDVTQKSYALGRFTYDVCRACGLAKMEEGNIV